MPSGRILPESKWDGLWSSRICVACGSTLILVPQGDGSFPTPVSTSGVTSGYRVAVNRVDVSTNRSFPRPDELELAGGKREGERGRKKRRRRR